MKKMLFCLIATLIAAPLLAAECGRYDRPYMSASEHGEAFTLQNALTNYVINFRYIHPKPNRPAQVCMAMPRPVPRTGFCRFNFSFLKINGIDSRTLEPKKFEIFNTKDSSGVDVHYNFDGVPMILRLSVSDSSPLLKLTWRRGEENAIHIIRTMSIDFIVWPCAAGEEKDSYSREVVSPAGKYAAPQGVRFIKQKLTARDTYLIFQDTVRQSGEGSKYEAPVVLFPDWKGIVSGELRVGISQGVNVRFVLNPKATEWSFGLLETEKKRTNAEFLEFLNGLKIVP